MFYRAAIVKEDKNTRSITLRETTKEKVEEMLPRIKSFLYPDEDTSEYRHRIWEHEIDGYGPGIKIPEYTVNVYRPRDKKVKDVEDGEDDWDVMEDGDGWFEDIVEADSLEEAHEKVLSIDCPYKSVGYDECLVYINEVPVSTLLEEVKHSISNRIENAYIDAKRPEMTVREFIDLHRNIEENEKLQYEAHRYMRSVLSHINSLKRDLDLEKISAKEFIDLSINLALFSLENKREEWDAMLNEAKAQYGKETND